MCICFIIIYKKLSRRSHIYDSGQVCRQSTFSISWMASSAEASLASSADSFSSTTAMQKHETSYVSLLAIVLTTAGREMSFPITPRLGTPPARAQARARSSRRGSRRSGDSGYRALSAI